MTAPGTMYNDLTGQKFGFLTALRLAPKPAGSNCKGKFWLCACACGKEKVSAANYLVRARGRGVESSCGCRSKIHSRNNGHANLKDLTGMKFGDLVVLRRGPFDLRYKSRNSHWVCRCVCGAEKIVRGVNLTSGTTRSCGCLKIRVNTRIENPDSPKRRIYKEYLNGASYRNHNFDLTYDQFLPLIASNCHYCGSRPSRLVKSRKHSYLANGIDRIDNELGYTVANCVPCCSVCNMSKKAMSETTFKAWISAVYHHCVKEPCHVSA